MVVTKIKTIQDLPVYKNPPVDGECRWMDPNKIEFSDFFQKLFLFDPDHVDELAKKINQKGYDISKPVVVRLPTFKLLYGHHRVAACKKLNIPIYVVFQHFTDEEVLNETLDEEALHRDMTQDCQQFRLSLTLYGTINWVAHAGKKKAFTSHEVNHPIDIESFKNILLSKFKSVNLSKSKIDKIVSILQRKDIYQEKINYILSTKNKKTINAVYNEIMQLEEQQEKLSTKKNTKFKIQLKTAGNEYSTEYNFVLPDGEKNILTVNGSLMQDERFYKLAEYLNKELPGFLENGFKYVKLNKK